MPSNNSSDAPNSGEELDLVTIFRSSNFNAEMEALDVRGVLESAGIDAVLIGDSRYPQFPFEVRVPRDKAEEAEQLIAEAIKAGPQAAEEAEAATEA